LSVDAESCPGSNGVFVATTEDVPRQCIVLTPGNYFVGGKFKGTAGTGSFVRVKFWSMADCSGTTISDATLDLNNITGDWKQYWQSFAAPTGTVSASVGVYGIQLSIDQMSLGTVAQF